MTTNGHYGTIRQGPVAACSCAMSADLGRVTTPAHVPTEGHKGRFGARPMSTQHSQTRFTVEIQLPVPNKFEYIDTF